MRVLVIGSGMAGVTAALSARAAGAEVTLVAQGPGATSFCSGAVWPQASPVAEVASDFVPVPVGGRLASMLGELASPHWALASQAGGVLRAGARVGVVGFRGAPLLCDAGWVANALQASGVAAVALEADLSLTASEVRRSAFGWASQLDRPALRQRLADALTRLTAPAQGAQPQADFELLLLPPMIGFDPASFQALQSLCKLRLAELLASVPSVPGLRLAQALEGRLTRAGCARVSGEVASLGLGRAMLSTGEPLEFDRAVLASGRFVGGGVRQKESLVEPLLGLPLFSDPITPLDLEAPLQNLAGLQPKDAAAVFQVGVRTSDRLQPLAADGRPVSWLFAAGSILAGPDRGLGFAQETGARAGRFAAEAESTLRSAVA